MKKVATCKNLKLAKETLRTLGQLSLGGAVTTAPAAPLTLTVVDTRRLCEDTWLTEPVTV